MRWVKIYDSILDWRWHHKPEYVSFMLHCLLKANPKPTKWETVELEKGQFVTSMKSMCENVGITERTYRTIVKNLTDCGFLTVKTTNKYSIVTICNYATYQQTKEDKRQSNDILPTDNSQTADKLTTDNSQTADKLTTTDIDNKNNRITDFKDKENKETFLKNGGTAKKKVFENLEDLKNLLNENKIYMTEQGYKAFKELNENPDGGYGYRGGVVQSARNFLKNPKNATFRKNPPPPPQQALPQPDKKAVEVWEKAKSSLKGEMPESFFKQWIEPIEAQEFQKGNVLCLKTDKGRVFAEQLRASGYEQKIIDKLTPDYKPIVWFLYDGKWNFLK